MFPGCLLAVPVHEQLRSVIKLLMEGLQQGRKWDRLPSFTQASALSYLPLFYPPVLF